MEEASEDLDQGRPDPAAEDQEDAFEALQEAREQVQEQLAAAQEEQQEVLREDLIALFREMLDTQIQLSSETRELDQKRGEEAWGREQALKAAALSEAEAGLSEQADDAYTMILDNSAPIVFPRVLEDVRDDLGSLSERLGDEETGTVTQTIQRDVEEALNDLIAALEEDPQDNEPSEPPPDSPPPPGGGGAPMPPPLVSALAELKLLRNLQVRINERTERLGTVSQEEADAGSLPRQADVLSERQESVLTMTQAIQAALSGGGRATP
jgi:tetratricopeptide (TPR) repeat protein